MTVATPDTIERVLEFEAPIDQVWRAVGTPEGISKWFGEQCVFKPVPGSDGMFSWEDMHNRFRVVAVEPPLRFAYRWNPWSDKDHSIPFNDDMATLVEFALEPSGTGTKLTVTESGFASRPASLRADEHAGNSEGWTSELAKLVTYLGGATN